MFQIQTSSLPLCHHFSLWPLSSTRAAKWRTHVKQAQEITSHSISACCSSVSGSRDGVRLLLCAPTGLLLIEADVDCVSHTCPRKVTLDRWRQASPAHSPHLLFTEGIATPAALCGRLSSGSLPVKGNRPPETGRRGDYHGLFVMVGTWKRIWVEKGGWLVAFKSDLFEKQQRGLVPKTQRQ